MFALAPKSRSATRKPLPHSSFTSAGLSSRSPLANASLSNLADPDSGPFSSKVSAGFTTYFSLQVTLSTTFPVVYAFSLGRISSRSYSPFVVIMPFMVPFSRKIFVKALVSMPAMPGTPLSSRNCWMVISHRKLLGIRESSRTMNPSSQGPADSMSSLHMP